MVIIYTNKRGGLNLTRKKVRVTFLIAMFILGCCMVSTGDRTVGNTWLVGSIIIGLLGD